MPKIGEPSNLAAPTLSFELMPPRSPRGTQKFWVTVAELMETQPDFLSVTYGAGGHNRDTAHGVTARLVRDTPVQPLAHLTCVGVSREETTRVIDQYLDSGVRSFLALRGDPPLDGRGPCPTELRSSLELIALIRQREQARCSASTADMLRGVIRPLIIAVATFPAGNPAAGTSATQEVERLLLKQAAGATFAITQLFYQADTYMSFVESARAAGVQIPIIPGILPPTNSRRLRRVAELSGVQADTSLLDRLDAATPERATAIGIEAGANLIRSVLEGGAPGVHLYTFNQSGINLDILAGAGLLGQQTPPDLHPCRHHWQSTKPTTVTV